MTAEAAPVTYSPLPTGPVVIGHRGAGIGPDENTTASFLRALDQGADWIELDVIATADNVLAVMHDHYFPSTDGDVPVWTLPRNTLGAGVEDFAYVVERLPAGAGLYIEVKATIGDIRADLGPATLPLLLPYLPALAARRPIMVATFDPNVARTVASLGVPSGWLTADRLGIFEAVGPALGLGVDVVVIHGPTTGASPERHLAHSIDLAHTNGLLVWEWGSTPATVRAGLASGVSGFCGDDVAALRAEVQR